MAQPRQATMLLALLVALCACRGSSVSAASLPSDLSPQGESHYYELVQDWAAKAAPSTDKALSQKAAAATDAGASDRRRAAEELELAKQISMNNPEFRFIGSSSKPTRMRDDMSTKVFVAMENLKKEAGDLWSLVSGKLDEGWTEARTMFEKAEVKKNLDKGLTELSVKLDKGWTDLKSAFEKSDKAPTASP